MITSFDQLDLSKQYTYADYLTWQLEEKVELIKGKVYITPPLPERLPTKRSVFHILAEIITAYTKNTCYNISLMPTRILLRAVNVAADETNMVEIIPCLSVTRDMLRPAKNNFIDAPDWIIEILSPGNNKKEMKDKFDLYQQNGVREYWVVYPEYVQVQVFDLINEAFVLRGTYINEQLPVKIFEDLVIDLPVVFKI